MNRITTALRPVVLVTLLILALSAGRAAALAAETPRAPKSVEPIPFPDGVIDPERRTAYVSSPEGGIQAIRLEDGKVLWTNDTCKAQPWLVAGGRLVARGERIFVLDREQEGKLLRQCDVLAFPRIKVPERCTVAFQLWGAHGLGDTLEAHWYGVAYIDRRKGRPFPFQEWIAFNKAAPEGLVRINLDTGRVMLQTAAKPVDVTGELIPAAAKPEQLLPPGLPAPLAALWHQYYKDQHGRITLLGEHLVGVSLKLEPAGAEYTKTVILNRWDARTGKAEAPLELVKDRAANIANIVVTADRRHAGVQFGTSAVSIYSLADGKLVGRALKGVHSPEAAFVDGKRLYYAQLNGGGAAQTPYVLRAIDLENGKVVWERALKPRSTIPLPP